MQAVSWKAGVTQMRGDRRLLGACNRVPGVALQGDLGWKKLEDKKEEMNVCLVREWKGWK